VPAPPEQPSLVGAIELSEAEIQRTY
jgi:hypothetical protein